MKTMSALKWPTISPARDTRQRTWVTSTTDTPNVEVQGRGAGLPAERHLERLVGGRR
jgi:hypothetical protein